MEQIKANIEKIEAEMKRTQVNKATEYHLGQLRAKQSKLTKKLEEMKQQSQQRKTGGSKLQAQPKTFNPRQLLDKMQDFNENSSVNIKQITVQEFFSDSIKNQTQYLQHQRKITNITQELIVYLSRFSTNEYIKKFGQEAFQRLYNGVDQEDRKKHLVDVILPLILKEAEEIDIENTENTDLSIQIIYSLIPFCAINAKQNQLLTFFSKIQQNEKFESIKSDVQQAIQLLSG